VHGQATEKPAPALAAKVDFLENPASYAGAPATVEVRETHMSWVFLAGLEVYKLKKPVRFPYLDFSTIQRRESACRAEIRLNRRLAPDIYLGVVPLTLAQGGLAIGGEGAPVDWLVKMKRLDERNMLDARIADRRLGAPQLDALAEVLARFYRRAAPVTLSPTAHLIDIARDIAFNKRVLLDPRFNLPAGLIRRIDAAQRRFLARHGEVIAMRMRHRRIVDGHGDLRPEHICLDHEVRIIDCIEFNPRLRMVDPFDEIAFLALECERLGARWAGDYLQRCMKHLLRDGPADELFTFYRCHRASLRARLAIAHLAENHPRTPEKWPKLARTYLALADEAARGLQEMT
jgi:aminoglycoside phosphotransferase family enzyme